MRMSKSVFASGSSSVSSLRLAAAVGVAALVAGAALADEHSDGNSCCCQGKCVTNGVEVIATSCTDKKCPITQVCICGGGCVPGGGGTAWASATCGTIQW
ncbi:MAG: hypothetical protein J0L78_13710 [Planctomycetes bacterium]|nr:hypothetical protein [Planctomycetota bacterium]